MLVYQDPWVSRGLVLAKHLVDHMVNCPFDTQQVDDLVMVIFLVDSPCCSIRPDDLARLGRVLRL